MAQKINPDLTFIKGESDLSLTNVGSLGNLLIYESSKLKTLSLQSLISSIGGGFQEPINPTTPIPEGGWKKGLYPAEVEGDYPIIGVSDVVIGSGITFLAYNGTDWSIITMDVRKDIPGGVVSYEKALELQNALSQKVDVDGVGESVDGYYRRENGIFTPLAGFKSKKFDISDVDTDNLFVTSQVSGGVNAIAVYYDDAGAHISSEGSGTDGNTIPYTNYKLTAPSNCVYIGVTTVGTEFGKLKTNETIQLERALASSIDYVGNDGITESSNGFYAYSTGVFNSGFSGWISKKYPVDESVAYYATADISGDVTALAVYFDGSGNYIGYQERGANGSINNYTRELLNLPGGTKFVGISSVASGKAQALENIGYAPISKSAVLTLVNKNQWTNKKLVYLGTSIPAFGYPAVVASLLGSNVINEAVGSSMVRIGKAVFSTDLLNDNYLGIQGCTWQNVMNSLSMTQVEKHYIMKNWLATARKATLIAAGYTSGEVANVKGFGELLAGNFIGDPSGEKPIDMMAAANVAIRKLYLSYCWDNSTDIEAGFGFIGGKIQKYLNTDSFPSLFIIDHGHNDSLAGDTTEQLTTIPADKFNRHTFLGAVNYIIDKILQYNPNAKICFVGHYTNQIGGTGRPPEITQAQINVASYWQFPLLKLWEFVPFSQSVITTTGYWGSDDVWYNTGFNGTNHTGSNWSGINQNPRQVGGVWVHDLTMKQVWLKDDLHPVTQKSKEVIANVIANWLKTL